MQKIMFNDNYCLTAAVIAETKKQTRRLVPSKVFEKYEDMFDYDELVPQGTRDNYFIKFAKENAPYKVGEVVAVAQPYKAFYGDFKEPLRTELIDSAGFMNKMFVKAELMLHKIEITNIRVQRLQDISDEDCLAEGIIKYANGVYTYTVNGKKIFRSHLDTPRKAFAELIDSISGKGTWESNPYVFVYNFKLVK